MVVGTGIDIVRISRIKQAHERWGNKFFKRVFTENEIRSAVERKDIFPHLSSRFAAKEAFVKALGTGFSNGISWKDIEIKREKGHRPFFSISGVALILMNRHGIKTCHLSISHEGDYAIAQVVLEGETE